MAIAGVGTKFRRWNASTGHWVDISDIQSIDGPKKTRDVIDTTSLDATDGYKTFIAGFRDGGTVTLPMNFTRATYEIMNDDYESDLLQNYEILLPDDELTSFEFEALVTELGLGIPADDKVTATVTLKISGKVTINSGSGSST